MNPKIKKLSPAYVFEGQLQHLMLLILLAAGALYLAEPTLNGDSWLGLAERQWLQIGIIIVIIHQVLGWFVFRFQLVYQLLTRLLGKLALPLWGIVFMPFLIARPLLVFALGLADRGTLPGPSNLYLLAGIVLLIPSLYAMWSVVKHFGISRALGGDHFYEKFRQMPLVKDGIYKFTSNGMYGVVFLGLWAIALLLQSRAALVYALFQHAYIWVHMYCTEGPDMRILYEDNENVDK